MFNRWACFWFGHTWEWYATTRHIVSIKCKRCGETAIVFQEVAQALQPKDGEQE